MMEKQRKCDQLFLLVGSNPLPNLLATLVLKPESVRFFYSPETEKIKDLLRERLKAIVGEESLCDVQTPDHLEKVYQSGGGTEYGRIYTHCMACEARIEIIGQGVSVATY